MIKQYAFVFALLLFISCSNRNEILELETSSMLISIDDSGKIVRLFDKINKVDCLSQDTSVALLSLQIEGELLKPISAKAYAKERTIVLKFINESEVTIQYEYNKNYVKFNLLSATSNEIELIIWGPYPTRLNKIIGETIGVVQGENFAIGLQSLNAKTLGGFPWTENDCMPEINIFDQDNLSDLSETGKDLVLYRVEAARPTKIGSSLQAYCRNRNEQRVISNLDHEFYISPKYDDGGIVGSSIAIFGCDRDSILSTIEKIELNENLPHPMIKGEWSKTSKAATSAYLIYDFSESSIDYAIELTKKAGLKYLYHSNAFKTWGHFDLHHALFPNGISGLKQCVKKANKLGIDVGVHTLSNFITTNDKYVTPIPDDRLGIVGGTVITGTINKTQTSIPIKDPKFFNQFQNNNLKTVKIDKELIRYGNVIEENGWQLIDCDRGAFGTAVSIHNQGSEINKLADHGYKVFLTNPELSLEVSKNISDLFNQTGLRQISFDGLEGNRSTGMGNYGEILFTLNWFNNLDENIKNSFIADASRTSHFFWHIYTRMNWGEPWYAGFRESQTEYRLKNQEYFKRNLMPGMLGWFQLRPETSIEDIEWMLARSAAYDAGYAFVVNDKSISENKNSEEIFSLIGLWEKARIESKFTETQKEKMKDIKKEFTLKKVSGNKLELTQVYSYKFNHSKKTVQPGEPVFSNFTLSNPTENQNIKFIIIAENSDIKDITVELNNHKTIKLPIALKKSQILKYEGGDNAIIYTSNWERIGQLKINENDWQINKGENKISFDCKFARDDEAKVKLEFRLFGNSENILFD